jgi:hypothetical protein
MVYTRSLRSTHVPHIRCGRHSPVLLSIILQLRSFKRYYRAVDQEARFAPTNNCNTNVFLYWSVESS